MHTVSVLFKSVLPYFVVHRNYSIKSILNVIRNFKSASIRKSKQGIQKFVVQEKNGLWKISTLSLALFGISGIYFIFTLIPEEQLDGKPLKNEFLNNYLATKRNLKRVYWELDYYIRLIREPASEKLLPDPLEYPYKQPKYTLVLELTDVLVHPEWNYQTGWRFKKRPLLGTFLESIHGSYETVIYTAEHGMTVFPLIDAIDPKNFIAYKLVRDATNFARGHHVKDLEKLNRDLSKVIYIDWNGRNVKGNSENLLKIKRWEGCEHDRSLLDLATLLKIISDNDIEDVREILKYYSKYEDPLKEFNEKQQRLIEELETQAAAKREQKPLKKSKWRNIFHI